MRKDDGILRIALTGKMRSGKDRMGWHLSLRHGFSTPIAFGTALKHHAHALFPDVPENPKPRELYQFMNVMRDFDPDVWVKHLASSVEFAEGFRETTGIVVTDARQANEIEWLRENGFIIVKIEAGEDLRRERMEVKGEEVNEEALRHKTEQDVDDIVADYTLGNFGTIEDFYEQVDELVAKLRGEA